MMYAKERARGCGSESEKMPQREKDATLDMRKGPVELKREKK